MVVWLKKKKKKTTRKKKQNIPQVSPTRCECISVFRASHAQCWCMQWFLLHTLPHLSICILQHSDSFPSVPHKHRTVSGTKAEHSFLRRQGKLSGFRSIYDRQVMIRVHTRVYFCLNKQKPATGRCITWTWVTFWMKQSASTGDVKRG